jgi:phospholipid/cholesterol/gamma-HCH transport system permease protein
MPDSEWVRFEAGESRSVLHLTGEWRLAHLPQIEASLRALELPARLIIDASALQRLDSACALVLLRCVESSADGRQRNSWVGLDEVKGRIVNQVRTRLAEASVGAALPRQGWLAFIGRRATTMGELLQGHLNFLGATAVALGKVLMHPTRLRLRELTTQLEQAGLDAIPVVALVTSLIGVVVAYLLGLQAEKYGANIFVVDGVGVAATREFAPIIVAVVVAGRSGAAFTAQLGSMRLTEEIDAIRTLGLDAWQVLVLPRVLALMIALPLLVFVGDVASLLGAMAVTDSMLDITPAGFAARLREALDVRHVLIGLVKAPAFALVIAVIGTRMGMTVSRDTRAVGAATTSTVVQGIVAVILLDAAFAVLFQSLEL